MKRRFASCVLILACVTVCHADCCWDSDGYAFTGTEIVNEKQDDPYFKPLLQQYCDCTDDTCEGGTKDNGVCTRIEEAPAKDFRPKTKRCVLPGSGARYSADGDSKNCAKGYDYFYSTYFCRDLSKRVGAFCSTNNCWAWGCGCDCIDWGRKRKLMQANADISSESNPVGECQKRVVTMYNTTSLRERDQIQAYFDCLDNNSDGILDEDDEAFRYLMSINASSVIRADLNQNGGIDPGEFDEELTHSTPSSAALQGFHLKLLSATVHDLLIVLSTLALPMLYCY